MAARIALCGSISEYMLEQPYGLKNYTRLRSVNGSMNGFFVYNFEERFDEAEERLAGWVKSGEMQPLLDIVEGFESMPQGLARLYGHQNTGTVYCPVPLEPYDR